MSFIFGELHQEVDFIIPGKELYAIEARSLQSFMHEYGAKGVMTGLRANRSGTYVWEILSSDLRIYHLLTDF